MYSRLLLLVCMLALMICTCSSANCTNSPTITLARERVLYEVSGGHVVSHAVVGGQFVGSNSISWTLDMMVERNKTAAVYAGVVYEYGCVMPILDASSFAEIFLTNSTHLDPLEPSVPGHICSGKGRELTPGSLQCGDVLGHIRVQDFDCWTEHTNGTLGGFNLETVVVHFSHPSYPAFSLRTSYQLLDADLEYIYVHPQGGNQTLEYQKDRLKVTYEMDGYPFQNYDPVAWALDNRVNGTNNSSWVSLWWNISTTVDRPFVFALNNNLGYGDFLTLSQDGLIDIGLRVNTHYLLDGLLTQNNNPSIFNVSYPLDQPFTYDLNLPVGICRASAVHFNNFWYDPTFSSLFTGGDSLDPHAASPKQKKDSKTLPIAVGVSVGVVIVLAAVVIILVLTVPAFKVLVRPFVARKHATVGNPSSIADTNQSAPAAAAWIPSSKPPHTS